MKNLLIYLACFYTGGIAAYFPTILMYGRMGSASLLEIAEHVLLWPRVYSIFFS